MSISLGVLMDPIDSIHYKKDSTLAMLFEAESRGWTIQYFEQKDLYMVGGELFANARAINIFPDQKAWFKQEEVRTLPIAELDILLMRKDPPFDMEYIYTTYLLEHAEKLGVLVVNKPQSLRDANEKLFTTWFPQCCPTTLVTSSKELLKEFYVKEKDIICKPLAGMGGSSVFRLKYPDMNAAVVFEVLTQQGTRCIMGQQYISDIIHGDKRIIMIDGEPIPFALARIPAEGELRGNLAAGAKGVAQPLTQRDKWICQQVGPTLKEMGLYFVGLDVIGDYLTEINVTSPTGIRELDSQCNLNISKVLFDALMQYV